MTIGRPRTPIGTWGAINTRRTTAGTWEARTRYRDADGRLRLVSARGRTAAAARNHLQARLADRGIRRHHHCHPQGWHARDCPDR